METPNKNKLVADAIAIVLKNKGITVEEFATHSVSKDFWLEVHEALPEDQKLDIKIHLVDRWTRKNKEGVRTNRIAILSMLGYVHNADTEKSHEHNAPLFTQHSLSTLSTQNITEKEVRRIVQEELDRRLSGPSASIHNEHIELCPEADTITGEGKGRRLKRKYERVSLTIDSELWKLFRAEQKRLNTTAPRLMDSILWTYYGKPKLSFE